MSNMILSEEMRKTWLQSQQLPFERRVDVVYDTLAQLRRDLGDPTQQLDAQEVVLFSYISGWVLAAGSRCVAHRLRPPVRTQIRETVLAEIPAALPALLETAWLLETRCPERGDVLFDDCVALAGFQDVLLAQEGDLSQCRYLMGMTAAGEMRLTQWPATWQGLALTALPLGSDIDDDAECMEHDAWVRNAVRFAVVFGILLEAQYTPLRTTDDGATRSRGLRGGRAHVDPRAVDPMAWVTRHVYLAPTQPPHRDPHVPSPAASSIASPTGRIAVDVCVRGHLRHQPCGPGHMERRWVYVAAHASTRWGTTRPVRVEVHGSPRKATP